MMCRYKLLPLLFSLLVVLAAPAFGKGADASPLAQERSAIDKRLAAEEAACYQKFAVNGCLRSARQRARSERAVVQQQDNDLKDAARRERTDTHRQELQDKQATAAAAAAAAEQSASGSAYGSSGSPRAHRPNSPAPSAQRSAAKQGTPAGSVDQERTRRAEEAERARQRLLEKQRAAAERAQAQQRRQAQREAAGHPPAAPLSDPP